MFEPNILLCRLCRKSSGPYVDIFNPKGTRGLIVWKVIKDLIQIDVSKDDMLPNAICNCCMEKVVDFRNFKTMCINSRIEFLKASASVGLVESECVDWAMRVEVGGVAVLSAVDSTCAVDGAEEWEEAEDPLEDTATQKAVCVPLEGDHVFCDPRGGGSGSSVFCTPGVDGNEEEGARWQPDEPMVVRERPPSLPAVSSSMHVHNGNSPMRPAEHHSPGVPCESEEQIPRQYLERRLDESIGSLKSCDAPNCRKVFSTYKALVIHKRAKHPDLAASEEESVTSVVGSPAQRSSSHLQGGDPNDSASHGSSEEAGMRIAELACSYPRCGMKFTNLSFLLNHQTTHPQQRDDVDTMEQEGESEDFEVLSEESWGSEDSGSETSEKGSRITKSSISQIVEELRDDEEMVEPSPAFDIPEAASMPEEPEYLCHAADCGRAFLSYARLVEHRKRAHSKTKRSRVEATHSGVVKDEDDGGKEKKKETDEPWRGLKCRMCGAKQGSVQSLNAHKRRCASRRRVGKEEGHKEAEKSPQRNLRCVRCGMQPSSMRILLLHQRKCRGGKRGRRSRKSGDGSGPSREGAERQGRGKEGAVVEMARVKEEPMKEEERRPSTGNEAVGDEEFECQFDGCPRVFPSFKGLMTHVTRSHGYLEK
ncbi:uncharacterized protein LOC124170152 isoform X1 [Ischnura elegans]|uniref:uncharacterized protein LOC124170152 isoform X1 n=1 Tax=Ischnura elegans TaxID=197161 RepID=UPI001ED88562|nr:uncharacterized protein LOC124170152 isoform X1 [Ischnura elegans]